MTVSVSDTTHGSLMHVHTRWHACIWQSFTSHDNRNDRQSRPQSPLFTAVSTHATAPSWNMSSDCPLPGKMTLRRMHAMHDSSDTVQ